MLEDFAAQIASSGTSESIEQVYDQYLNFVVSEPNLFSLGMGKDVYYTMNSAALPIWIPHSYVKFGVVDVGELAKR